MYHMQYLLPDGFPAADGRLDPEATRLGASLKGVDTKGAYVPNSALWLKLKVLLDGASLEIKKREQLVYINLFCLATDQIPSVLTTVDGLYDQYRLGVAKRPTTEVWIHSVPVGHHLLRENEIQLCQKLTVSFFWAVYRQHLKRQNPLN